LTIQGDKVFGPGKADKTDITAFFNEEKIAVSVQDFGIGISPEYWTKYLIASSEAMILPSKHTPVWHLEFDRSGIIKREKGNIRLKAKRKGLYILFFTIH